MIGTASRSGNHKIVCFRRKRQINFAVTCTSPLNNSEKQKKIDDLHFVFFLIFQFDTGHPKSLDTTNFY